MTKPYLECRVTIDQSAGPTCVSGSDWPSIRRCLDLLCADETLAAAKSQSLPLRAYLPEHATISIKGKLCTVAGITGSTIRMESPDGFIFVSTETELMKVADDRTQAEIAVGRFRKLETQKDDDETKERPAQI